MCMIHSINMMEILLAADKIDSFVYNDDDDSNNDNLIAKVKENKTTNSSWNGIWTVSVEEDTINA